MSKAQRIWIDMTDLQVWSGHMTGVQRVVYQNAKHFNESKAYDAHFFVFDAAREVFVETSFDAIQADIEAALTNAHAQTGPGEDAVSLSGMIKRAPRALIRRIPASIKQKVPTTAKHVIKRSARMGINALRQGKRMVAGSLRSSASHTPPVVFTAADTVLVMGKSWDFPGLIPALGRLKQSQGFKLVHLIHDMIPILEPHLFGPGLFEPYTKCMFEVCSLSDGILTVSESTKRDVARFCGMLHIPVPPMRAVRLGDDVLEIDLPADMPPPDPRIKKGEFILQVGTIELRKNHLITYLAYREALLKGIELPTWVIMGSQGWMVGDLLHQMEHDPLLKDKIIILRGRPDIERLWLYKHCRFTVFPSTYEGWGMPVSESLAYGKVCITSTTASLPEAGNGFADSVSPYNSQEMLEAILKYLDDKKLRALEKQITNGYKIASWTDTFKQIESFVRAK